MKYKLVISDFDWTLGHIKYIEPETAEAIRKYQEQGGKFVVCTGRFFYYINGICKKYGIHGLISTCQGAQIRDVDSGEIFLNGGIDYEFAVKVAEKLEEDGFSVTCYMGDNLVHSKPSRYVDLYKSIPQFTLTVPSVSQYIKEQKKTVLKFVVAVDEDKVKELSKKYQDYFGDKLIVNNGGKFIIEFIEPVYNKGNAVKFIADYYKIPYNEVLTIGDSTNDYDLIKGEWHGVAVGDGDEKLKQIAKEVTVPFEDQPVKVILEKYCLDK